MRKLQEHNWHDTSGRNGVTCVQCGYCIVISKDDETKNGSKHVPEEKTIYTDRVSVIDDKYANYLCKVWGIRCKN